MLIANQIPKVFAVLRYVIMTENRVCYFPCGPQQSLSSPGRPAVPTACQRPGEEAQVNDSQANCPDDIQRKEGVWGMRHEQESKQRVVEEEVGWGRWVLLRCTVWREGKSSKTEGKERGGVRWHMKRGRKTQEGRWRVCTSVCHWRWQVLRQEPHV